MSIDLFYNTSQISAYIIISFCISALVYFPPIISITNNLVASIVILIYLLSLPSGTKGVMDSIVNVIFTLIFSSIISYRIYTYHANDYINNSKLIKFNKKLEIAEKIRTDFFANVSHELKTPLNILYTANQMIEVTTINDNYKNEKFSKYMKICKQNTNRLHRLISNLIDITKIDSASFKLMKTNCDIVNLVEDITLSAVCYVESRGISLIFDTDIEELIIACDPDNIERIILNLLSNAIKFTKSGGEINVEIKT
ncbi:MAG: HAMP domain-containing sensor histidine kinase, partial [Clostridium celatum]|nr:HAMP domain-containing sensor histidine kinase [Clostridium celatum]